MPLTNGSPDPAVQGDHDVPVGGACGQGVRPGAPQADKPITPFHLSSADDERFIATTRGTSPNTEPPDAGEEPTGRPPVSAAPGPI
jgi:hypothetical protein